MYQTTSPHQTMMLLLIQKLTSQKIHVFKSMTVQELKHPPYSM